MEDLLTPQICMDIDDTPLDVGKDSSDDETQSEQSQSDDDNKVQKLLTFDFKEPAQVPDELTDFEKEAKRNVFGSGELAVQYHRLHCTACNKHLGSAPIAFFDRYIHPLLKVIMCKSCYDFYCSGEFDKDEDGSEMYCRWCGQGGKVMCCAQCAYVFCQKCVRQNLGKKTLEIIKDSDDWMCFGCNPPQLLNLKIICASLYDFMQEEIKLAKALVNVERLKVDHSMCCAKLKSALKRRRDEDETYSPYSEEMKLMKKGRMLTSKCKPIEVPKLKPWSAQKEDGEEVVCAPDVLSLMDEDNSDNTKIPPPLVPIKENKEVAIPQIPIRKPVFPSIAPKPLFICSSGPVQKNTNNFTNIVRIQSPAIKLVSPTNTTSTSVPLVSSIPVQLVPGLKHDWFERAATVVSTITGNLSITLDTLTGELRDSKTVENLATVHNKLQELLSTSINSLIQVRKSLRNQFLTDLNNLKFTAERNMAERNMAANKLAPMLSEQKDDDDDVVIVKSDIFPKKEPLRNNGRPYLKVRTVSQLLSVPAECITIPDDPPEDPLKVDEVITCPDEVKENEEEKVKVTDIVSKSMRPQIIENSIEAMRNEIEIAEKNNGDGTLEKSENTDTVKDNSENNDVGKEAENDKATTPNNDGSETNVQENDPNIHDLSQYDTETSIMIRNALIESKLDQIIEENLKCVTDFAEETVRKMLSVRVVVAVGSKPDLPKNRLRDSAWLSDDIEELLTCAVVPTILNERSLKENSSSSSPASVPIESGAEEEFYKDTSMHDSDKMGDINMDDGKTVDDSKITGNVEQIDSMMENVEEHSSNSKKTEGVTESLAIDGVSTETAKSLSVNESDLSDKETDPEKNKEKSDKKILSDGKETNSENLINDLEDITENDNSKAEGEPHEPITDSGIEVDNK